MGVKGKLCGLVATVVAVTVMQAAGCSELKLSGGETAENMFQAPQAVALAKAGCEGDVVRMEALVEQGADVNAKGREGVSVLTWVMTCKNYLGIEKLLELGADPNRKAEEGDSPMWLAAGSDDSSLLTLMLKHGGDPNIWSGADSALMVAMDEGRTQSFQLLLDHGADVNAHDSGENTVATYAAVDKKYDVITNVLEHGYNYELPRLARIINNSVVPANSPLAAKKQKVLDMLRERGVKFPLASAPKMSAHGA